MIEQQIKAAIRDIPDFPNPGIVFKDITPILKDPALCDEILEAFVRKLKHTRIDVVAGVESRGFLFGLSLACKLGVPFVPVRKAGKLPYTIRQKAYSLEYGTAVIEMHTDAFDPGQHVLIHDDLLATGGTVLAASELVHEMGGTVAGFAFVVGLGFLDGVERIKHISDNIIILADY
ncbi:MAG TPA: adenine phosphoribosyltransferase [Mucilaginibacter sp.]|nr:adenine phosphoribosyltransferase [Mucilaginibacter sp.]